MPKIRTVLLQASACLWLCASSAFVDAEENLKETLQARYAAMKVAMAAHDAAAIGALLAPGFKSIDVSGEAKTASQMIAEVDGLKTDPNKSSTTTLVSVTTSAGKLTVEQVYDMRTTRLGADGAAHPVRLRAVSMDTWIKSGNDWLLEQTITKEMSLYRDDNLIAHKIKP